MNWQLTIVAACFLGASLLPADGAARTAADWVRDLGSPKHEVRERAEKELLLLRVAARDAVRKALSSSDPEVKSRAQRIWRAIRWGIDETLALELARLLAEQRAGKTPSLNAFVEKSGLRAVGVAAALLEERDEPAHVLARRLVQAVVGQRAADVLARQMNDEQGVVGLLASLGPDVGQAESRKVVKVLNLLWRHELAATAGLRALQRWPDDPELVADTLLAVRAGGNAAEIWGWLGKRRPDRAQFLLLAHLADAFGEAARFGPLVEQGVPEGLKEGDLAFLADFLIREDLPKAAVVLLANAESAKLRYQRCRILASLGDRQGAAAEWQVVLTKLTKPGDLYSLAEQMEKGSDSRAEEVWRKLLGDGVSKDVYASNACFRLAAICKERGDYAAAADLYQAGLDRMEGAILMTVNGKGLSQDQARERIRKTILELRAQAKAEADGQAALHPK